MAMPELRSEVLGLCDTFQAILAFNYHYDAELRATLDAIRAEVPTAPARRLREHRDFLRINVKEVVRKFGYRGKPKPEKFAQGFKENSRSELGISMLPKFVIDKMFANYTDKWVDWQSFPPHVFVYLDFTAKSHRPNQFDWKLPEASLYEDMCLAYNLALDSHKLAAAATVPVPEGKLTDFCTRSTILSAFYFVEAYLNGIAFDFFVRNGKNVSLQDADALLEWDHKADRERWLNFKEKIYRYQRIILGVQHPPLTENSSPELRLIIGKAKEIRDAIVHQSPKMDFDDGGPGAKLSSFMNLRFNEATEIVDASICFVRKLNAQLGKNGTKLDWLVARDSTGRFPDKAFV